LHAYAVSLVVLRIQGVLVSPVHINVCSFAPLPCCPIPSSLQGHWQQTPDCSYVCCGDGDRRGGNSRSRRRPTSRCTLRASFIPCCKKLGTQSRKDMGMLMRTRTTQKKITNINRSHWQTGWWRWCWWRAGDTGAAIGSGGRRARSGATAGSSQGPGLGGAPPRLCAPCTQLQRAEGGRATSPPRISALLLFLLFALLKVRLVQGCPRLFCDLIVGSQCPCCTR
jgi:hypothetical protein